MRITGDSTDSAVLDELGARLRRQRLERNLSQSALAEQAGVGRVTLQRIEEGRSPSATSLVRVLRALDLLERVEGLVPEPSPSPIEELRRRGRRRQRAGSPRSPDPAEPPPRPWRWPDEERS
jgi:transcriptional regulator with XRE-family HTH domain